MQMNIAIVIAGGSGRRTGQDVPKQFLNVYDVPIFIYTLNNLETLDCIDEIIVVGPLGWENYISSYAKQFDIYKFKAVVTGGDTRFDSIMNGLEYLKENRDSNEVVATLIDANRPLIPHQVIQDGIDTLKDCSCTLALEPCYDSMFCCKDGINLDDVTVDRSILFAGQTPETARLSDLLEVYGMARKDHLTEWPMSTLFLHYNKSVKRVKGSRKSMKITTIEDFELFKALLGDTRLQGLKT